jgi:hypothetical protein
MHGLVFPSGNQETPRNNARQNPRGRENVPQTFGARTLPDGAGAYLLHTFAGRRHGRQLEIGPMRSAALMSLSR